MILNSLEELEKHVFELRQSKIKPIVVCVGTFKYLGAGHLYLFRCARKLAGTSGQVICLINSTSSIKKIKPKAKYIMDDEQRKVMVLFAGADFVYMFDDKTPKEICKAIKPDILVKGGDWKGKFLPEAEFCKRVKIIERIDLTDAEKILRKIDVNMGR